MFDTKYALEVAMPIAEAAYSAMDGNPVLPDGFTVSALIRAGELPAAVHPLAHTMTRNTNILGVIGSYGSTVFVSFRGTETVAEWLQDFTVFPERSMYGDVADGFLDVYQLIRSNMLSKLPAGPMPEVLVVGHSLGGALAMFAALDISNLYHQPTPTVLTFASPRVGLRKFASGFNQRVGNYWRVTNFLDVVPHVPLVPYVHAGTHVAVNSGGPAELLHRHMLPAYRAGLLKSK